MISQKHLALSIIGLLASSFSASVQAQGPGPLSDHIYLKNGINLSKSRRPEEAVAQFDRCKNLACASGLQLYVVAKTYLEVGNPAQCVKVAETALGKEDVRKDKGMTAMLLELRGDALGGLGKIDAAVDDLKKAAEANPGLAYQYLARAGEFVAKERRYQEALPLLQKGIHTGNMNGFTYQFIGKCYLELHQPAKAIEPLKASINAFDAFRKKKADSFMAALVESHKYLIRAYEETSNRKEALIVRRRLDHLVNDLDNDFFGKP